MKHFFTLLTLTLTFIGNAQSINLETNFGTNGIKSIDTNGEIDRVELIDINTTHFLAYTKVFNLAASSENIIFKIKTDGTLDTSFGTNGKLILPNYNSDFKIFKQNNNHFIVAFGNVLPYGSTNNQRAILRYNENGILDTTFGTNGEIRINYVSEIRNNIVILNDDSILFSDLEKFMKFTPNGLVDATFGVNGVLVTANIGNMINSEDGNLFFYNSLEVQKKDYTANPINTFGTNGVYNFPTQNDYLCKANTSKLSFIELGDLPLKFYNLNSNGTLNTNFNQTGSVDLTNDFNTLKYYDDFIFSNNVFYFVGETQNQNPFIVAYDSNGNLIPLNNANSYQENQVSSGLFTSVIAKNNELYTAGDSYDSATDTWKIIIAKYNFSTLSTDNFDSQNQISFQNPIQNELKIASNEEITGLELFSIDAKLIKSSQSNLIETEDLNNGMYLLKVRFRNNQTVIKKIIKN